MKPAVVGSAVAVAVITIGAAVYMGDHADEPQKHDLPYTNVWSADDGVDMFSRERELVRATAESARLVYDAGLEYAYPGYREAITAGDINISFRHNRGEKGEAWFDYPNTITNFNYISEYSEDDRTVTATICQYVLPTEGVTTKSASHSNFYDDLFALDIRLDRVANDPGRAGPPDREPTIENSTAGRTPNWNVFEGWKISRITTDKVNRPQSCVDWYQQQLPGLTTKKVSADGIFIDTPPEFEVPPRPISIQYPEWIERPKGA